MHLAGEGTAEVRRACKSQGGAQVKFEETRSCYGWGLSPGRGRRRGSSQGMHLTGLGGSGASRVPAPHPPPSPVPAPAAHGACLGQMPAGSNRERPKLFGSCEEEEPVLLPAHPPSPYISPHPPAEGRGGGRAGRAVAWARQEKLLTGGRRGMDRGIYSGLGRAGGRAAAAPGPFRAGWRGWGALRGAPRPRGEGLTAEQPPGSGAEPPGARCGAPRPALPPRGSALPQRPLQRAAERTVRSQ